jgi:hypothetical protein
MRRVTLRSPARALVALGFSIAATACSDPVAPELAAEVEAPRPNAAVGLNPNPGTLRETFGSGMVILGDRDQRIDVCPAVGPCFDAYVLDRNPRWAAPIAGTRWIGPRPVADDFNSVPVENDVYVTTFTLPKGFKNPVMNLQLYADNAATIYVNGVQIGQQPQGDFYPNYGCIFPTEPAFSCTQFRAPFDYTTTGNSPSVPWKVGVNTLRIVVLNATYKQGCEDAAPGDPLCKSATALDFKATVHYSLADVEGCSQGYWKNHERKWPSPYTPSTKLKSVFAFSGPVSQHTTLEQALDFGGGSGILGAQKNLFRQAVAALLNAQHPDVEYALTASEVVAMVNAALASNDRETMLELAEKLDRYNNKGCPLDGKKDDHDGHHDDDDCSAWLRWLLHKWGDRR